MRFFRSHGNLPEVAREDTEILTLAEAAKTVRLCEKTLVRAIKRGDLVASKLGGRWRIRRSELEAWFESRRYVPSDSGESRILAPLAPPERGSAEELRAIEREAA